MMLRGDAWHNHPVKEINRSGTKYEMEREVVDLALRRQWLEYCHL